MMFLTYIVCVCVCACMRLCACASMHVHIHRCQAYECLKALGLSSWFCDVLSLYRCWDLNSDLHEHAGSPLTG